MDKYDEDARMLVDVIFLDLPEMSKCREHAAQALRSAAADAYEDAAGIARNAQCSCIDPDAKCDGCSISHSIAAKAKAKALRGGSK